MAPQFIIRWPRLTSLWPVRKLLPLNRIDVAATAPPAAGYHSQFPAAILLLQEAAYSLKIWLRLIVL
jgi:hypothetical protein